MKNYKFRLDCAERGFFSKEIIEHKGKSLDAAASDWINCLMGDAVAFIEDKNTINYYGLIWTVSDSSLES